MSAASDEAGIDVCSNYFNSSYDGPYVELMLSTQNPLLSGYFWWID
jgi:hypothetical protein